MPEAMIASFPDDPIVRLAVPRSALPVLARRLGLVISEGYDEAGVFRDLLGEVIDASSSQGMHPRVECRSCGHAWNTVPVVALCPVCGSRYLRFDSQGGTSR